MQYTECKYGRPLGRPISSCAEAEASEASRVLFWVRVLATELTDMVSSELLRA